MASFLTHALWTGALVRGQPLPRRAKLAAIVAACAADLDFILAPFSQSPDDLLAHRGLLHAPLWSVVIGGIIGAHLAGRRGAVVVALAGVGHALLDALTWGGPGVAFFAPLSTVRFLLPLKLAPVVPLGLPEYLSALGLIAVATEVLFILVPTVLILRFKDQDRVWFAAATLWLLIAVALRSFAPVGFSPPPRRELTPTPTDDSEGLAALPQDPPLVTRFEELRARKLFDRELVPKQQPWSSGFFPYWLGGHAGRWRDPVPVLLGRTLFGAEPSAAPEDRVSPTEKYDLVRGDASFTATSAVLKLSHNARPRPRFWFGLCNGVAGAAIHHPEPFRVVEVKGADGKAVRFHPNDIKALLAAAWFRPSGVAQLGDSCRVRGFDAARRCEVHPAALVVAVLNGIGIAERSFLVDVHATPQAQYYAVSKAKVRVAREPDADRRLELLVELELASTLVSSSAADVEHRPGVYRRVGARPVYVRYPVTLQLDEAGTIVGGRYDGVDGPDQLQFIAASPDVTQDGRLVAFPELKWSAIEALAKASVASEPTVVDGSVF